MHITCRWCLGSLAVLSALFFVACSGTAHLPPDVITVEGTISARGHEPFGAWVLETPENNFYVLRFDEPVGERIRTTARYRVTGRLYLDDWDGRPFAHLEVMEWEEAF